MGRSFAEASQRVGVFVHDERGCGADAVAVLPAGDEFSDCSAGGVLHRDSFGFSALAEGCLLAVGEAKCHGHAEMVSVRYRTELPWLRIGGDSTVCS